MDPLTPLTDWLAPEDRERITTRCLRIESVEPHGQWLLMLYDAYAELYLKARTVHVEHALTEEVPALVHDKAIERGWQSIPQTRPTRRIRGVFSLMADRQPRRVVDDSIPRSEYTRQFGKYKLPPWYVEQFVQKLGRRIRHWRAELRDQNRLSATDPSALALLDATTSEFEPQRSGRPLIDDLHSESSQHLDSPPECATIASSYSETDEEIFKKIKREALLQMTNNEIAKAFRKHLPARFQTPGNEGLRACLNRIRRYHGLPSSDSIRHDRSPAAGHTGRNLKLKRGRRKAVKDSIDNRSD